jgi:apolipoprotein N-acyltransferase
LRAIENRISIIRGSNTGISGWVSFEGRIEKMKKKEKEVFFSGADDFNIALSKKRSFYNKNGDVFVFFCAIFLLGVFIKERYVREVKRT